MEPTQFLVVDDSAIERRLAGAILEREFGAQVSYASSGAEALELCQSGNPDIILTDLCMPLKSGIELIHELQSAGVHAPIILMTGHGNEEMARQALRAGAASYVPKLQLCSELSETVRTVLSDLTTRRERARLLKSLKQVQFQFELANDLSLVAPLVTHIQEDLLAAFEVPARDSTRIGVALHESLTNAIYHGNLDVSSDLRQVDDQVFYQVVDDRRMKAPWNERRVFVTVTSNREKVHLSVRDEGAGFDVRAALQTAEEQSFDRVGGRGLLLIRGFMDELTHNANGNEIRMSKCFAAATEMDPTEKRLTETRSADVLCSVAPPISHEV